MEVIVSKILDSNLAIYHEEGLAIYEIIKKSVEAKSKVLVSFTGIEKCSTLFLNAAIGKLYLDYNPKDVDSLISYEYTGYDILKSKLEDVRDNAINSKEYDAILENA